MPAPSCPLVHRLDGIRRSLLATVVLIVLPLVSAVGASAPPAGAQSSPLVVTDCNGASVTIPGDDPDDFAGHVRSGDLVMLHNNVGDPNPFDTTSGNLGHVPMCAVQQRSDGSLAVGWSYCTDEPRYACGQLPAPPVSGNPRLTPLDEARISAVIRQADNRTPLSRAEAQLRVWCASEHVAAGTVFTSAQSYFAQESITISDAAATCPDWSSVDPYLHTIHPATLSVTASAAAVSIPEAVRFTLTTNVHEPATITTSGPVGPLAICADDSSGATLASGVLTIPGAQADTPATVHLCGTISGPGTVTIDASAAPLGSEVLDWFHDGDPSCQVFAILGPEAPTVSATASVDALEGATTTSTSSSTTTSSTTASTSSTTPATTTTATGASTSTSVRSVTTTTTVGASEQLVRTGRDDDRTAIAGLALLLIGGAVLVVRRRTILRS